MPDPIYDVFISYSHLDEKWVTQTLLPRLESAGLKVCIDFRDFKAGRPSILNMQDGVRTSRRTVLVLTQNWFNSEWTLFESLLAGGTSPAGLKESTIPVLLSACTMPDDAAFIKNLTYVDFTRADREAIAWRMLLTALGKAPDLESPPQPKRAGWHLAHPYAMPPNFTGRSDERALLSSWLNNNAQHPLFVLRALGGFGKSALAWQWLTNEVDPNKWPRVVWWSFYEGDASFDAFVGETLEYLTGGKTKPPPQISRHDVDELLYELKKSGTLLVLDGFERVLRAFGGIAAAYQGDVPHHETAERECIPPLADFLLKALPTLPGLRAKVLLTTRLRPHAVETRDGHLLAGCREVELLQMQPTDAVAFFRAQGIRGTYAEIAEACNLYGCHPLSLRLLAGVVAKDFQQPGDIAAAKRLDVSGDQVQRQHHVLETAYKNLTPDRRKLLGRIACFRSPVSYDALKALAEQEPRPQGSDHTLDADLHDLVARGLLHHDTESKFDLHPIVRRYAYDRLAAPDRAAAHTRLRDYFAAVPKLEKVTRIEDLAPVIELYHHTVLAGHFDEACNLYYDRLWTALYYQLGAYQLVVDLLRSLFPNGEFQPPSLKEIHDQAWTLNELANAYSLSGQPRRAIPLFEQANAIEEKRKDYRNLAVGLGNVAYMAQVPIGRLCTAESNLRRSLELCGNFNDLENRDEMGRLLAYRGEYSESERQLAEALEFYERLKNVQCRGLVWSYRALRELLLLRTQLRSTQRNPESAIAAACRALELAYETERTTHPYERDYVVGHWMLGAAQLASGQHIDAEHHLREALERCRRISLVELEAAILIDLARLRFAQKRPTEAQSLAEEALNITERCGYVLQGADAHLELAKYAVARREKSKALEHATEARKLATCDGPPDYTYKVAYDEAGALLDQLKS